MKYTRKKLWSHEMRLKRLRRTRKGMRGLREGLNTRELGNQYLRYLNEEGDRGELSSLMAPDGQLVLPQRLQKAEYERLQEILRIVQRNRQRVSQLLLRVLLGCLALSALIGLTLKGPLMARFVEGHLEKALFAPVKIDSPTLHWDGTLEYAGIIIGKPYLFVPFDSSFSREARKGRSGQLDNSSGFPALLELGPGTLKISLWALLVDKLWVQSFFSRHLELNPWSTDKQEGNPPEKENLAHLEIDGIIADAKKNFQSFRAAQQVAQSFSEGKDWLEEITRNQERISGNYGLLDNVDVGRSSSNNQNSLIQQSQKLLSRIQGDALLVNRQLQDLATQLAGSSEVVNSVNTTFSSDFETLQQEIRNGIILQAPISNAVDSYLRNRMQSFAEISLWLAAIAKNIQQYHRSGPAQNVAQEEEPSILFANNVDRRYRLPTLFYPDFHIQYFEAGFAAQQNLRISAFSSDGDAANHPIVAVFQSFSNTGDNKKGLQLLYENREVPRENDSYANFLKSSGCIVLGLDTCKEESKAVLQYAEPGLHVPNIFFANAGLEFIHNYNANLELEIIVRPNMSQAGPDPSISPPILGSKSSKASGQNVELSPSLAITLHAKLNNASVDVDDKLNALQQALVAILSDFPLEFQVQFYLSEQMPQKFLGLAIESNIEDVLNVALQNQGAAGFQNAIIQLRSRFNEELYRIIEPLDRELAKLRDYRYRLQQQSYAFSQQKKRAETALNLIRREVERQNSITRPTPVLESSGEVTRELR